MILISKENYLRLVLYWTVVTVVLLLITLPLSAQTGAAPTSNLECISASQVPVAEGTITQQQVDMRAKIISNCVNKVRDALNSLSTVDRETGYSTIDRELDAIVLLVQETLDLTADNGDLGLLIDKLTAELTRTKAIISQTQKSDSAEHRNMMAEATGQESKLTNIIQGSRTSREKAQMLLGEVGKRRSQIALWTRLKKTDQALESIKAITTQLDAISGALQGLLSSEPRREGT
jgi:hypothetical protein